MILRTKIIANLKAYCATFEIICRSQFLFHSLHPLSNQDIREALDTIGNLNNIALDNYCSTLMKVRTQQAEVTSLKLVSIRCAENGPNELK